MMEMELMLLSVRISFFSSKTEGTMEETFYEATSNGKMEEVKEILRKNPTPNVNWKNDSGWTAIHVACWTGRDAIVSVLLAHPDIDLNLKNNGGYTPFSNACCNNGSASCVREMLKDSRVKVNEPANDGCTPLWRAARAGHLAVIKWWIASERGMDLGKPGDVDKTDAIGVAKGQGKTEVATLLERFKSDATKTRGEVRMELGINGQSPVPPFSFKSQHFQTIFYFFPIQIFL